MKNGILTLMLTFFSSFMLFAQDKIVKADGTEVLCVVKEIGTTEIKYVKADNLNGPMYTIKKSEVIKIIFENGTEEIFDQNSLSVIPAKNRNYKRAITTRPFAPLMGHLSLGYQQALTPSRAFIAEIGFIGVHIGDGLSYNHATGAYGRIGFRLKRTPEVVMEGMEWGYNLGGFYVQPEIAFSSFDRDYTVTIYNPTTMTYTTEQKRGQWNSGAFLITLGRQMIVGEIMTLDLSAGIGYGFANHPNSASYYGIDFGNLPGYYFSHSGGGNSFPIAWKLSFSLGFMLK